VRDFCSGAYTSGCGKTTLLKVMLGLLEPTSGEILIDGVPLRILGHEAFRKSIGVVMQDDQLLSGSIADNICFFDESFKLEHMVHCAELAGIDNEICHMPMAYNSLIGDMGTSLSGGQKQRVLLARALYRRPRLLFMDEGTSHLDIATERQVTAAVKALGLTRVIIAHRPERIALAPRQRRIARIAGERAGGVTEAGGGLIRRSLCLGCQVGFDQRALLLPAKARWSRIRPRPFGRPIFS
jgi:ABC-type bacteriocin/lantibiotic exporter with double-glycine peptidase domain